MKYRKKPVVIEAYELTEEVFTDGHPSDKHIKGVIYNPIEKEAYIETLEGTMTARLGDYIIKGVHGEIYPCKPDIFQETYELV